MKYGYENNKTQTFSKWWAFLCVCVEFKQERNKQNPPLQLHVEIQQIEDEIGQDSYACDEILNHLRVLYIRYVEICNLVKLYEVGYD